MFNEAERRIFGPYFNGVEMVYADPLRIYRQLQAALDGDTNAYLERMRSEAAADSNTAKDRVLAAVISVFGMPAFDPKTGQGTLEQDAMAVLRNYLEFMHAKKEMGQSLRTYSVPTRP